MADVSKQPGGSKQSDAAKDSTKPLKTAAADMTNDLFHNQAYGKPGSEAKVSGKDKTHAAAGKKPEGNTDSKKTAHDASDKHTASQKHETSTKRITDSAARTISVTENDNSVSAIAINHLKFDDHHSLPEKTNAIIQLNAKRFGHPGKAQDDAIHNLIPGEKLFLPKTKHEVTQLVAQYKDELLQHQKELAEQKRQEAEQSAKKALDHLRVPEAQKLRQELKQELTKQGKLVQEYASEIHKNSGFLGTLGDAWQQGLLNLQLGDKNPAAALRGILANKADSTGETAKKIEKQLEENTENINRINKAIRELETKHGQSWQSDLQHWQSDLKKTHDDISGLERNAAKINQQIGATTHQYAEAAHARRKGTAMTLTAVGTILVPGGAAIGAVAAGVGNLGMNAGDAMQTGRKYDLVEGATDAVEGAAMGGGIGAGRLAKEALTTALKETAAAKIAGLAADGAIVATVPTFVHSTIANARAGLEEARSGKKVDVGGHLFNVFRDTTVAGGVGSVFGAGAGVTGELVSKVMPESVSALFRPANISGAKINADRIGTTTGVTDSVTSTQSDKLVLQPGHSAPEALTQAPQQSGAAVHQEVQTQVQQPSAGGHEEVQMQVQQRQAAPDEQMTFADKALVSLKNDREWIRQLPQEEQERFIRKMIEEFPKENQSQLIAKLIENLPHDKQIQLQALFDKSSAAQEQYLAARLLWQIQGKKVFSTNVNSLGVEIRSKSVAEGTQTIRTMSTRGSHVEEKLPLQLKKGEDLNIPSIFVDSEGQRFTNVLKIAKGAGAPEAKVVEQPAEAVSMDDLFKEFKSGK